MVDFYADWCGPCKLLGKVLTDLENDIDVDVIKLNIDKYPEIARQYGVMSIPTIILFENEDEIKRNVGFMDQNKFKDFIK